MMNMKINKISLKKFAFSLAEVTLVFAIIAVITTVSLKINKSRVNYAKNHFCYAAYKNLALAVEELISEGCTQNDIDSGYCTSMKTMPIIGHNAESRGLCDRLSKTYNMIGATNCTLTATSNFSTATPNFITSNGMRFFNLGSNAVLSGSNYYYNLYIDIDEKKGKADINEDVNKFLFLTNGTILLSIPQANDTNYLKVNVVYGDSGAGTEVAHGTSFAAGYCASLNATKYAQQPYASYCADAGKSNNALCTTHECRIELIKPGF